MPNPIPWRFSEACFRRYEPAITDALAAYPKVIAYEPQSSLETFTARFRDAIRGHIKHRFSPSTVDPDILARLGERLSCISQDGKVLIGPLSALKLHKPTAPVKGHRAPLLHEGDFVIDVSKTPDAFIWIASLFQSRAMTPQPSVILTNCPALALARFSSWDVAFEEVGPDTYRII